MVGAIPRRYATGRFYTKHHLTKFKDFALETNTSGVEMVERRWKAQATGHPASLPATQTVRANMQCLVKMMVYAY
jgi:hypothetical protein